MSGERRNQSRNSTTPEQALQTLLSGNAAPMFEFTGSESSSTSSNNNNNRPRLFNNNGEMVFNSSNYRVVTQEETMRSILGFHGDDFDPSPSKKNNKQQNVPKKVDKGTQKENKKVEKITRKVRTWTKKENHEFMKYLLKSSTPELAVKIVSYLQPLIAEIFRRTCKAAKSLFDDHKTIWATYLAGKDGMYKPPRRSTFRGGGHLIYNGSWGLTFIKINYHQLHQKKSCIHCKSIPRSLAETLGTFYGNSLFCEHCATRLFFIDSDVLDFYLRFGWDLVDAFETHDCVVLKQDVITLINIIYDWNQRDSPRYLKPGYRLRLQDEDKRRERCGCGEIHSDEDDDYDEERDVDYDAFYLQHADEEDENVDGRKFGETLITEELRLAFEPHMEMLRIIDRQVVFECLLEAGHKQTPLLERVVHSVMENDRRFGLWLNSDINERVMAANRMLVLETIVYALGAEAYLSSSDRYFQFVRGTFSENFESIAIDIARQCVWRKWVKEYPGKMTHEFRRHKSRRVPKVYPWLDRTSDDIFNEFLPLLGILKLTEANWIQLINNVEARYDDTALSLKGISEYRKVSAISPALDAFLQSIINWEDEKEEVVVEEGPMEELEEEAEDESEEEEYVEHEEYFHQLFNGGMPGERDFVQVTDSIVEKYLNEMDDGTMTPEERAQTGEVFRMTTAAILSQQFAEILGEDVEDYSRNGFFRDVLGHFGNNNNTEEEEEEEEVVTTSNDKSFKKMNDDKNPFVEDII